MSRFTLNKFLMLLSFLIVVAGNCFSQSRGVIPLHTFFQKNADSTIVLEYNTDGYEPNYYFVLTKTGDTINSFRYLAKINYEKVKMPKVLKMIISLEKYKGIDDLATINQYFNVVDLSEDTLKLVWKEAGRLNVWKIVEDNSPVYCKNEKKVAGMIHRCDLMLQLITKDKIKLLHFNCPWLEEERCPGNFNRKGAIGVDTLFRKYFPNIYN